MRKNMYLIVDCETTINDHIADIGAIVCDSKGDIYAKCGVLVSDFYNHEKLFYDKNAANIWGYSGLIKREENYKNMLNNGLRTLASIKTINNWFDRVNAKFPNIELTAYNLAFDLGKARNSGINLEQFTNRFCLWHSAAAHYGTSKKFKSFILNNHLFNNVTAKGNLTYKTNAEVMCAFLTGNFMEEPHTALEDCMEFELPILKAIVKRKKWREKSSAYNWRNFLVKDHFKVK